MPATNGETRPAMLAGSFYPADAGALAQLVDDCIGQAAHDINVPKAIVAPHAGYVYSGPIAGTAYATVKPLRDRIRRVVLLGPSHRHHIDGFAVPSSCCFETPLGPVPVDRESIAKALKQPDVHLHDQAHLPEHCLETQLPFLQRCLDDFSIVPILVGAVSADRAAALLQFLWGGAETLIVVSSDLSHFHDYETARNLDRSSCQAMECLEPDALRNEHACGRHAVRGLLLHAQGHHMRATTLDLRNSGDTAGASRRDSVVGYAALGFEESAQAHLSSENRNILLGRAAKAIASGLRGEEPQPPESGGVSLPLRAQRASFVTLKNGGALRGCVGSVYPQQALVKDVAANARKAAFADPRFEALDSEEFSTLASELKISISILSRPSRLDVASENDACAALLPNLDGVILRDKDHSALFLPQVWQSLPEPRAFLGQLMQKAGLGEQPWSSDLELYRFRCESFSAHFKEAARFVN